MKKRTSLSKKDLSAEPPHRMVSKNFDPLGSYTGNTENPGEKPEQDADDL